MSDFLFRANTVFFIIWIALMLYGFYKYYKYTDFRSISFLHLLVLSVIIFILGFITASIFLDIGFLILLLFVAPFLNVEMVKYALMNRKIICTMLLFTAYFVYFLRTKIQSKTFYQLILISYLLGLFVLGSWSFFEVGPSLCF
jgi:hypothetical protein